MACNQLILNRKKCIVRQLYNIPNDLVQLSRDIKFLGVHSNRKLTWNYYVLKSKSKHSRGKILLVC